MSTPGSAPADDLLPEEMEAVSPRPGRPAGAHVDRIWLHVLLFVITCVTTTWAGLYYVGPPAPEFLMGVQGLAPSGVDLDHWWRGLPFSATLMGILLTHEFGHYFAARRHRVAASLPYFIPLPLPMGLGTLGAVISLRERIDNRNTLMDIGASGPIAGLVVAIPALIVGLALSSVETVPAGPHVSEGNSLLYLLLKLLVTGEILPWGGRDVFLHPIAWAAWVGLLVTMINLIPVGQLDGGHIAFAYFGKRYEAASRRLHIGLPMIGLGVLVYVFIDALGDLALVPPGVPPLWLNTPLDAVATAAGSALPWFVWYLLLRFLRGASGGRYHPDVSPVALSPGRRRLGIAMLIVFLLILTPIPMRAG